MHPRRKLNHSSREEHKYLQGSSKKRRNGNEPETDKRKKFQKEYRGFDKVIEDGQAGKLDEPILVGMLLAKRPETGRYLFEFECNGVMFEAFSLRKRTRNAGFYKIMKIGYTYILEGNLHAVPREPQYSYASNCDTQLTLNIYLCKIVECVNTTAKFILRERPTFKILNEKIASGEKFSKEVEKVEILKAEIQRYLGCPECSYGLLKKHMVGEEYKCERCDKGGTEGQRVIYINLKNVTLKDSEGNLLEGGVLHHHNCELLFGKEVLGIACESFSDSAVVDCLKRIRRTRFSCTIKHAMAQGKEINRGPFKLTIQNLVKIESPDSGSESRNESESNDGSDSNESSEDEGITQRSVDSGYDLSGYVPKSPYKLNPTLQGGYIGLGFIVNIGKNRCGSNADVQRLQSLLPTLGVKLFKNRVLQDLDFPDFVKELTEFKEELINERYSSSFVVIMSHGNLHTLTLADNKSINVYKNVVQEFGEIKFRDFDGNPKIFIFHGCQSYPTSEGISAKRIDATQRNPDVLICFPCDPGVKAKRNKDGCPFIQTIADVLESENKSMHLGKMMIEVQERVSRIKMSDGSYNVPNIIPRMFGKFFFCAPDAEDTD